MQGRRFRSQNSRPELPLCWGQFQKQSNQGLLQQEPEAYADENLSGTVLYQLHRNPHQSRQNKSECLAQACKNMFCVVKQPNTCTQSHQQDKPHNFLQKPQPEQVFVWEWIAPNVPSGTSHELPVQSRHSLLISFHSDLLRNPLTQTLESWPTTPKMTISTVGKLRSHETKKVGCLQLPT